MMRQDIRQLTELLKPKISINSFIEIGSRDGHDTKYIRDFWNLDDKNCFIIEAHPDCYSYILNTYPSFQTFNIAASDKTSVLKFNAGVVGVESNIGISSVLNRTLDSFTSNLIEVDGWRMDDVMSHLNIEKIDLAKIDVEGFALQVLQGFGDKLSNFKALQIELEVQQVWEGQSYYTDVVSYMISKGFYILDEVVLDSYQKDVLFINQQ